MPRSGRFANARPVQQGCEAAHSCDGRHDLVMSHLTFGEFTEQMKGVIFLLLAILVVALGSYLQVMDGQPLHIWELSHSQ